MSHGIILDRERGVNPPGALWRPGVWGVGAP